MLKIGGKRIQITLEDIALTFGIPIEGYDFLMNKTCTLKDWGFVKHYFRITKALFQNYEEYHKNLNWRRFEWSFGKKMKETWIRPDKKRVAGAACDGEWGY